MAILVSLGLPYVNISCIQVCILGTYRRRFLRTKATAVKEATIYRKHNLWQISFSAGIPDVRVNRCEQSGKFFVSKKIWIKGLNTPVTRIQKGFKQGAEVVIIDGRNTGVTLNEANTIINRALGTYGGKLPGIVEIFGR